LFKPSQIPGKISEKFRGLSLFLMAFPVFLSAGSTNYFCLVHISYFDVSFDEPAVLAVKDVVVGSMQLTESHALAPNPTAPHELPAHRKADMLR
jgi:hypothetical protein